MSPYLRSMLQDAADDSGRPVTVDLGQVRAGGRRAVWRRRGLAGLGGVCVAATVTSVALLTPWIGSDPTGGADAPLTVTSESPGSAGSDIEARLTPLIDAISDAGYVVEVDSPLGTTGLVVPSSGAVDQVAMTTGFRVSKGDKAGVLLVAQSTDLDTLGLVSGGDVADAESSAGACPVVRPSADPSFGWSSCEASAGPRTLVLAATSDGTAVGATVTGADGSNLSLALSTTAADVGNFADSGWFAYAPVTPVARPSEPLSELPLTPGALGLLASKIAADGPVFSLDTVEVAPTPNAVPDCPPATPLVEMTDDLGTTSLVSSDGVIYACTTWVNGTTSGSMTGTGVAPEAGFPLDARQFGLLQATCNDSDPCDRRVRVGWGDVPQGVARISYETPDGQVTDANIAAGVWLFRHLVVTNSHATLGPIVVRLYDASGALLLEGDVNAASAPATSRSASETESADGCPAGAVLAEKADELGRTALIAVDERVFACTTQTGMPDLTEVVDLWSHDPVSLDDGLGALALTPPCGGGDCASRLHFGANVVPAGVARISFATPDGMVTDADIVDGRWIFRHIDSSLIDDQRLTVQAYDTAGVLLLEGDISNYPGTR